MSRLLLYHVRAHRHAGLPVHSVAVLLRSNAKAANLTGELAYAPHPTGEVRFRFEVVKVWERPVADLLAAGPGLMPLAVLGKPPPGQTHAQVIPGTLVRVADEARRQVPDRTAQVVASALILAGMHADRDALYPIVQSLQTMGEKNAAIEILEGWGAIKHVKQMIWAQGREKFGKPTPDQETKLKGIEDLDRLNRLGVRLLKVKSWDALLKGK